MMSNREYIEEWLDELKTVDELVDGTLKMYKTRMNGFVNSLKGKSLTEVDRHDIIKYLSDEGESINTKKHKESVVCNFYMWMCDCNYVTKHPFMKRKRYSPKERLPKFLEKEQWEVIDKFMHKNLNSFAKERNWNMIYFMVNSGLRSFEVLGLRVEHINFEQQEIKVIGKRDKERIVQVNAFTIRALKSFIDKYNIIGYVFANIDGKKLSKSSMDQLFTYISKKTGFHVNPHMLRHTYGQWEYDKGIKIGTVNILEIIQKQMGHSSIDTTKIYAKIRNQHVKDAINQPMITLDEEAVN